MRPHLLLKPSLPIYPPFDAQQSTPCLGSVCLPAVHVLTGWHMLSPEDGVRPFLARHPQIEIRERGCFNLWGSSDAGAEAWVRSWGGPPADASTLVATTACSTKILTWHPEYAGRFWTAGLQRYEQCREANRSSCDALRAHEEAIGSGGTGHEAVPPFVLRTLYGSSHKIRLIATLRSPVDRLETAFWFHKQFWAAKGPSAAGLHAYATEQVREFGKCALEFSARRCAFLFERLGPQQASAFWHCNQIIRGLYQPFVAEWRAAFPSDDELLVLRVEELLDRPARAYAAMQRFLGLAAPSAYEPPAAQSYLRRHLASLNSSCCGGGRGPPEPMRDETRELLEGFYAPHNEALAELLRDPSVARWGGLGWRADDWRAEERAGRLAWRDVSAGRRR